MGGVFPARVGRFLHFLKMANHAEESKRGELRIHLCIYLLSMTIVVGACFVLLYGITWPVFVRVVFGSCAVVTACVSWNAIKKLNNSGASSSE